MRSVRAPLAFAVVTCLTVTFGLRGQALGHAIDNDQDRKDLEQKYILLQALDTGYEYHRVRYAAEDLPEFSKADIGDKIEQLCGAIVCYYVYLAGYHQRLVRHHMQKPEYLEYLKKYSFFREARLLLIVAYAFNGGPKKSMRPLWLSFMYELYLLLLAKDKLLAGPAVFPAVHDTVIAELTRYTSDECHQKNKYNSAYGRSAYSGNLQRLAKLDPDSRQVRWVLVAMNRYRVVYQVAENELTRRAVADTQSWFSVDALYLNWVVQNEDFMVHLLRDFAEQRRWKTVLTLVRQDFGTIAQQDRPDRWMKRLGHFLDKFVDLLKAVMLRIVCGYVDHLRYAVPTLTANWASFGLTWITVPCMLRRYGRAILDSLNEFVRYFNLERDVLFTAVIVRLGNPVWNFITERRRTAFINDMNAMMADLLTPSKLKISYGNGLHTDNKRFLRILHINSQHDVFADEGNVTPDALVSHSIAVAAIFVEYLKKSLNGISMKVIRSYIEFARDLDDFQY